MHRFAHEYWLETILTWIPIGLTHVYLHVDDFES
jgi:hypothetical protein